METEHKKCPLCAEEILSEAQVCRFCGARFEVSRHGYCSHCHGIKNADSNEHCLTCAEPLIDLVTESQLIEEPKPAPEPLPPASALPSAVPAQNETGKCQRLRMFLVQNYAMPDICAACGQPAGVHTMRAEASHSSRMGKLHQSVRLEFPLCDACAAVRHQSSQYRTIGCWIFVLVLVFGFTGVLVEKGNAIFIILAVLSFLTAFFFPYVMRAQQSKPFREADRLIRRAATLSNYHPPTMFRSSGSFDVTLGNNAFARQFTAVNGHLVQSQSLASAPSDAAAISCGIVLALLGALVLVGYLLAQCQDNNSLAFNTTQTMEPTRASTLINNQDTSTPVPTASPAPSATPIAPFLPAADNGACFSSREFGITCLSSSGWNTGFTPIGAYTSVYSAAVCPDQSLLLSSYNEVWQWQQGQWHKLGMGDVGNVQALSCGKDQSVWVLGSTGLSQYTAAGWQDLPINTIQAGENNYKGAIQAAVDPSGRLWVVTDHSIARRENNTWRVFKEGDPLDKQYDFVDIALDSSNQPWAAHNSGLLHYDGEQWLRISFSTTHTISELLIDAKDQVWIGTSNGLYLYQNGSWVPYSIAAGKTSKNVRALAMDEQGRLWVGTTWGLAVLSDSKWSVYQMHTSGLETNRIEYIQVWGEGPALPEAETKENGSISGRLLLNDAGLAKARVEICVEYLGMLYTGATPCSGQALVLTSTTDAEGYYTFTDVPAGCYSLIFRMPSGDWKMLSETFRVGSKQFCVSPGSEYQVETLDAGE